MAHAQWRERLQQTQAGFVSLILLCLLAVMVLSTIRDPIVIDIVPIPLIVLNGASIICLIGMLMWSHWRTVSFRASNVFVFFAVLIFAIKAIAVVYVESQPYPLIMALLMFGLSLCFLSHLYLLATAMVITAAWCAVALVSLTAMQMVSTLVAMLVGCVFGLLVLERRIVALIHVFALEQRVSNLETILPMCASCKKTRDSQGNWITIETYMEAHEGAKVSHGVCPDCSQKLYGDVLNKRKATGTA